MADSVTTTADDFDGSGDEGIRARLLADARFWSKVDVGMPTQCWPWRGGQNEKGYGRFKFNGSLVSPHRYVYERFNGQIPEHPSFHGLVVMHACDQPNCVNPAHLRLGTQGDNVKDMADKGRRSPDACGKPLFPPEVIAAIRDDPRPLRVIAAEYGCAKITIWNYKTGKRGGPPPQSPPSI